MNLKFLLLLILAMVSWGIAWPFGKMVAGMIPIPVLVFWRFLVTFFSVIPLLYIMRLPMRLKTGKDYWNVLIGGIIYTLYNQFFFLGLKNGLPGAGGVLVTTLNPIVTFFIVVLVQKKTITKRQVLGLFFGFIGGLVILQVWKISINYLLLSGNLFFLLCSFVWAILSLNSQKTGKSMSPITYSFYVYGIGSVLELLFCWNDPSFWKVSEFGYKFWFAIFYLSVISTTFGTTVYFYAATKLGSEIASSFIFIVPLSAYLSSYLILDEVIQIPVIIGGSLAMLAVYLINSKYKKKDKLD
ncbi:DMT family transporter [Leptospira bouyouniensis]|uniref:DMT family transporter n=1 Tax=Leptospira bouyouniensis TaxID=2484911 RepID=A0A7I0HU66_9LEPT|nr:DMT family transporter [Leptospira bouyouniensis]TGK51292.1 DMT family transporter [Leptospira bouyouniensis]TGL07831.1 DMT family transporter [Leptospira bouyouniensis]TGM87752.1 DMT family transporter [Leptospira bouyouniensis]